MRLKLIALSLVFLALGGCGSTPDIKINYEYVSKPNIGTKTTASMGERLFRSGRAYMANCVIPNFTTIERMDLVSRLKVVAGAPLCEKQFTGYFYPQYDNWLTTTPSGNFPVPFEVSSINGKDKYCSSSCIEQPEGSFISERRYVFEEGSFQQVIEYMGKSGDTLEFTYSEFTDGLARDAFTRTFKVDLKDGNIIYYKGAEVEIVEAKSSEITYIVIKGFQ
jgi:hypothetical protein